jgi:predicted ATPase
MINKINIKNFKCYKLAEFSLSNLTVFCGNNSVGKSTAIQALGLLLQSRFESKVSLNGELISLGYNSDIHNSDNLTENQLSITIHTELGSASWGYESAEEAEKLHSSIALKSGKDSELIAKNLNIHYQQHCFQYLQAERFGPRDYQSLPMDSFHEDWLGSKGEFTNSVLNRLINIKEKRLDDINIAGIRKTDFRVHLDKNVKFVAKNIEYWMSEISPGFNMHPKIEQKANISYSSYSNRNGTQRRPVNMGFGLSYSLSIVTALLNAPIGGLVVIENPEAHLHPRGQSYLGRLIALTALSGVQVIVETHSDHLLNGIRVTARLNNDYISGTFKVYYISSGDIQSHIDELPIGNKGELPYWPSGFFDQQALDVKSIIKGENIEKSIIKSKME